MTTINEIFFHSTRLRCLEGQSPAKNIQYVIERNGKYEAWAKYEKQALHKVQVCDSKEKAEHWLNTALKFLKLTRKDVPLRHFKGN
jgi:hypothetical protein